MEEYRRLCQQAADQLPAADILIKLHEYFPDVSYIRERMDMQYKAFWSDMKHIVLSEILLTMADIAGICEGYEELQYEGFSLTVQVYGKNLIVKYKDNGQEQVFRGRVVEKKEA